MNLFNNAGNLIKLNEFQRKNEKKNNVPQKIGAKISAQISKDLGGGKYLLKMGNQTVAVQSTANFQENETVNLQVIANNDGNVELELTARGKNNAVDKQMKHDSAKLATPVQLKLPTVQTAELTSKSQDLITANNEINLTVEIEKNTNSTNNTSQKKVQKNSQSPSITPKHSKDIPQTAENIAATTSKIKIYLPDGKIITAEIIPDSQLSTSEEQNNTAQTEESPESENNKSTTQTSEQQKVSDNTPATKETTLSNSRNASKALRSFLTELAEKLLNTENSSNTTHPGNQTTQLKIQNIIIPILLKNLASGSTELINLDLPLKDLTQILPQLIDNSTSLTITTDSTGLPQLTFTSNDTTAPQSLPLENPTQLANLLQQQSDYQFIKTTLGKESLIEATLIEELTNNTNSDITAKQNSNLLKPQLIPEKIDRLLQQQNITPSKVTREAASILLDNKLPITRNNIQDLLAISAGREGNERTNFLQAGAKMLALDIPLSPALAAGMSTLNNSENFLTSGINRIIPAIDQAISLTPESPIPQDNQEQNNTTHNILQPQGQQEAQTEHYNSQKIEQHPNSLHFGVPAQQAQTTELIHNVLITAKETLNGIPILIEALAADSDNIDQTLPNNSDNQTPVLARELQDFISTSARERLSRVEELLEKATTNILRNDSILSKLSSALESILNKLGNQPTTAEITTQIPAQSSPETEHTNSATKIADKLQNFLNNNPDNQPDILNNKNNIDIKSFIQSLNISRSPAAHPGLGEFPDFWKTVELDQATINNADTAKIKDTIEEIIKAKSPEQAKEIAEKTLKAIDRDTLRTLSSALQEIEKDEIQKNPLLKNIREASSELRDIGRALVAQKAENLANSRNDPASFNTSIPFNFNGNEDGNDGQLSMHYRRTRNRKGDWQQRVVLDLNMSVLGNIIGDIQFYERQLNINLISTDPDTVEILASDEKILLEGLNDIGFSATLGVKLLKKTKTEEKKEETQQNTSRHILDIKI